MIARLREQEGAVAILTAVVLLALMAASAVAVDIGRLAVSSRDQQGATDRAALDGLLVLLRDGATADVAAAVAESLAENTGVSGTGMSGARSVIELRPVECGVEPGTYSPLAVGAWGDPSANGVEVRTVSDVTATLLPGGSTSTVERRAVACTQAIAAISAAGTTATVEDGLAGALLHSLFGGALDASLVGWQGLARADVSLAELAVALGAGTLDQLLATEVTAGELAHAIVGALQAGGNAGDVEASLLAGLLNVPASIPGLPAFAINELIEVSTSAEAALATDVDALGLLLAGLQIANHKAAAVLDLDVPGVTEARLSVIEPPNIAIGPPGNDAAGNPRTQARSAQLGLDVKLPVGEVRGRPAGLSGVIGQDIAALVQPYRTRIDNITTCSQALTQRSTSSGTIRSDLERDIRKLEQAAADAGLTFVINGLLSTVNGLLSGLTGTLSCLLAPSSTRDSVKSDLRQLADTYQQMLVALANHEVAPPTSATSPAALSIRLAQATNTLTGVNCADEGQVRSRVRGDAARAALTAWTDSYVANPPAAPVQLLDVNLGLLRVQVSLGLDTPLGSHVNELVQFDGPFATYHEQGTSVAGVADILPGAQPIVSGTHLLGLPLDSVTGDLTATALGILTPVLADLDGVLTPVVDLLGAELGGVHAGALDANCTNRALIR